MASLARLLNPKEYAVQDAIIKTLRLAGFGVLHTSAFRQKGASGVSKGVPDLLVYHELVPQTFFALEVKRPGPIRYSSPEQKRLAEINVIAVAQDEHTALALAHNWLVFALYGFTDTKNNRLDAAARRSLEQIVRVLNCLNPGDGVAAS